MKHKFKFKKARTIYLKKGIIRNVKIFIIRFWHHYIFFKNAKKNNYKEYFFKEIFLNGIPPLLDLNN